MPPASPARDLSAHAAAEAVFGKTPAATMLPKPRTITSRKGRQVRVETRRAKAHGQMELGL